MNARTALRAKVVAVRKGTNPSAPTRASSPIRLKGSRTSPSPPANREHARSAPEATPHPREPSQDPRQSQRVRVAIPTPITP